MPVYLLGHLSKGDLGTLPLGDPFPLLTKREKKLMAKTPRTFLVKKPIMKGKDVEEWQHDVKKAFDAMDIKCPIKIDGVFGPSTRSFTAALVHANGMSA